MSAYDPDMRLGYGSEAPSLEVTLRVVDPDSDRTAEHTWDNLTNPLYLVVSQGWLPVSEELVDRLEVLLPEGERELRGTEGTEVDGVTGQSVLDAWRERQGAHRLLITVHGDPAQLEEVSS